MLFRRDNAGQEAFSPSELNGNGSVSWRVFDAEELRKAAIVDEIRALMARSGDRLLAHDPIWLTGALPDRPDRVGGLPVIYGLWRGGRLVGYAPFIQSIRTLRFAIGELTLYRYRVPSLILTHDITTAITSETERVAQVRELLSLLTHRVSPAKALSFEGLPIDSVVYQEVVRLQGGGSWINVGGVQTREHHFANLPSSFDQYERQLGSRSRRSLRYSKRKLLGHLDGALLVRRYTDRQEIPEFIAVAQAISRKTYQWKLLKLGLRNTDALTARLNLAVDHGWMRSYILYCREKPVAFMLGYLYRGIYYYIDVGYDPVWSKWSVGSILQIEVIRDLLSGENSPTILDFSVGFAKHKARFANLLREETNLFLLQASLRNHLIVSIYYISIGLDKGFSAIADALGVKPQLKKWLRRIASG